MKNSIRITVANTLKRFSAYSTVALLASVCLFSAASAEVGSCNVKLGSLHAESRVGYFDATVMDSSAVRLRKMGREIFDLPVNRKIIGLQFSQVGSELRLVVKVGQGEFQVWDIQDLSEQHPLFTEPPHIHRQTITQKTSLGYRIYARSGELLAEVSSSNN